MKPKKETVTGWVHEAYLQLQFEDDIFFNVILRDFEEDEEKSVSDEDAESKDGKENGNELIQNEEADQEFEEVVDELELL